MHFENNMFEIILNTVMDVKLKTKDNMKAKMDIPLFRHRKNMELVYNRLRVVKPKVNFVLNKNAQIFVYQ
jgi:hypothetical protein